MSIVFTREEFTKMYGEHPDWMWDMLAANAEIQAEISYYRRRDDDASSVIQGYKSESQSLRDENARLRKALEFYAGGDLLSSFHGEERYLEAVSDELDISKIDGEWRKGKRARNALEGKE